MATKNISLKVADTDPSGYTYVGLYADSSYTKELTTNKLYTFDVTSGSTTDLFLKYKKSPFTLRFKCNSSMAYTISMSYEGTSYSIEVPVGVSFIERSFELSENATNQIIITSVVSTTVGQEVGNIELDDAAITLPYTRVVSSWNGQTHVISVDNIQTTTTTSTTSTTTPLPTTTTSTTSTTTSTTSTPAPAVVNMTSNVSSTAYIIVPGQEDKTVTLAANTKTGVAIDMG